MNELWKLILYQYKNKEILWQTNNKDIIVSAFRDMIDNTHHSLWKSYINGLIIFPEMTEIIIEYMEKKGMTHPLEVEVFI